MSQTGYRVLLCGRVRVTQTTRAAIFRQAEHLYAVLAVLRMNTPVDMARQLVIDCPFIQKGHSRIIEQGEYGPCLELTFLIPALSIVNTLAEFQQRYEQRQTGHGPAASGAVLSPSAASGAVLSQTSSHNGPDGDSGHAETVPASDLPGQGGSRGRGRGSHTIRQGGLASTPAIGTEKPLLARRDTSARDWLNGPQERSAYRVPDKQQPRDDTTWDTPVEDVYAYVTEDYRARVTWSQVVDRQDFVADDALSSMLAEYVPIPLQPPCVGRPTCKPPVSASHESSEETCKADLHTAKRTKRERPEAEDICQWQ